MKIFWQPWGCRGCPHQKNCVSLLPFDQKRPKAVVRPWLMLQKIYFLVFERYIPELKKYDSISFLHQPMASGQPLKIVQRHMAHPVEKIVKAWIQSHHLHLQWKFILWAGKFAWGLKAKHCRNLSTHFWKRKVCWHHSAMFCRITSSKLAHQ